MSRVLYVGRLVRQHGGVPWANRIGLCIAMNALVVLAGWGDWIMMAAVLPLFPAIVVAGIMKDVRDVNWWESHE